MEARNVTGTLVLNGTIPSTTWKRGISVLYRNSIQFIALPFHYTQEGVFCVCLEGNIKLTTDIPTMRLW
jgi:hypothetical protein